MSLQQALIPLFTHLLPLALFICMGLDVLIRNSKKTEHRLVSIITLCYSSLFLEEYVRQLLPISYSPALAALWFSNTGILIPGLGFHFTAKLTGMDKRMPRFLYPYVFYVPALFPLISIFGAEEIISTQRFVEIGMWKQPVYNTSYYIALIVSTLACLLYLFPLLKSRARAASAELKSLYTLTTWGVVVTALWIIAFGLFNYGSFMPPYPYIYCGLLWCFTLRLTMRRHDFLNFVDKRYEKLFHLNPAAIVLLDRSGAVRETNPAAEQLVGGMCEDREAFYSLMKTVVSEQMRDTREIKGYEATVHGASKRLDVLLDGDYIMVDNEPHIILIVRDVTAQREYQEEIRYLAYHDPLTRLPNRRYFYERLEPAVAEAKRRDGLMGIVLIDLDYFKDINDKYGHKAGDEALLHTSRLLREAVADRGLAARLGGDEFVLLLPEVASGEALEETIRRLRASVAASRLICEGQEIPIAMSIGASLYPQDGADGDALMHGADKAMYAVKRRSRNDYGMAGRQ
ncbi:diguanylate cyclase domain-containing protein [Cohnella sp. GCM10012308]|uniref:diguanylate cyclase domain-containing protein n=1 Tax=Cohnella sp. GCM10012308 TaxID=3317329 RepID=UPI00360B654E